MEFHVGYSDNGISPCGVNLPEKTTWADASGDVAWAKVSEDEDLPHPSMYHTDTWCGDCESKHNERL